MATSGSENSRDPEEGWSFAGGGFERGRVDKGVISLVIEHAVYLPQVLAGYCWAETSIRAERTVPLGHRFLFV